ncbi:MAG: hypothetical protein JRM85_03950 [Nitrososphaerota archaeon]|jgi:hypothetical protein|nr:hypothetical protein [Nitrososphaerota archaeon]MDG6919348.1 hypothetical protein [Nitrososphaerota archaeon]MDG6946882.1 hypothetical protein [Nitrososphaerota archaeon]
MPDVGKLLRGYAPYFFWVIAVVWVAVGVEGGSTLIAWPVTACAVSGVLLKLRPGWRLTFSWSVSSAVLGLLISVYQVYAWSPLLAGDFSSLAASALGVFTVLAVVHVFLLYAGAAKPLHV